MSRELRARSAVSGFWLALGLSSFLALAPAGAAAQAGPPSYSYTEIGVFGTASSDGRGTGAAWDTNSADQVVGASTTNVFGAGRGFRCADGRITNLGVIGGGTFAASAAYGVNEDGVVVGQTHVNGSDPPHAFRYRNGVLTDLGTGHGPGSFSRAWEINDAGVAVGERSRRQSSPVRAVMWRDGRIRDLGTLGGTGGSFGTGSVAYDVNRRRQVVGAALPSRGPLHPFLWQRGTMRDLGTLGGNDEAGEARAINDATQVVGSSPTTSGPTHAFLWQDGIMRDLGTLGGNSSHAYGINGNGDVVGGSRTPSSPANNAGHAFLWTDGQMIDLNSVVTNLPSNVTLEVARAINDNGSIVGTTCTAFCEPGKTAPTRAFLLVPN
jgi:probable HAF family extracellular repeat protein